MIKYVIILINMLALLVVRLFFAADVSVKMEAPSKVKQGEEFTVTLTINKGDIAGVGHMKQTLPSVFGNAIVVEAKGSEFNYLHEDNAVKFTWVSLPADQEFTVSYKVKVNVDAPSGKVDLGGKFSYVLDNQKQSFELPEQSIQIGEEVMAAASTTTIQPESTAVTAAETEKISAVVTASRTIVGSPEAGMEFTVELNVHKDGIKGFARIQEILPEGLTAMQLEAKGGTFSFFDRKVKIIWDNLPLDEDVKVSYRIVVADNIAGDMTLEGSFSYVEADDPKKVEIPTTRISVKPRPIIAVITNTAAVTQPETTAAIVPAPENTVNYKVQICALSKLQRGTGYFESKFAISDKVNMEFHEGWRKYIVGKYIRYGDARDYREKIRLKGIENPFVTAYNAGKRITVQEALMVSNQLWIR